MKLKSLNPDVISGYAGRLPSQHGNLRYEFTGTKTGLNLSARLEYFAWRMAYHGHWVLAHRELFGEQPSIDAENVRVSRMRYDARIRDRVPELLQLHKTGKIDLANGPWDFYGDCDEVQGKDLGEALV